MRTAILIVSVALSTFGCRQESPDKPVNEAATLQPPSVKTTTARLVSVERTQSWTPPPGGNLVFTRGMSMTLVDGSLSGVQADDGYEIVIARIEVTPATGAHIPMTDVYAYDDKGEKYKSAVTPIDPVGGKPAETIDLGFPVKVGTVLTKVELTKDLSVALK